MGQDEHFAKARMTAYALMVRRHVHDIHVPMGGLQTASHLVAHNAEANEPPDPETSQLLSGCTDVLWQRLSLLRFLVVSATNLEILGEPISEHVVDSVRLLDDDFTILDRAGASVEQRLCTLVTAVELSRQVRLVIARGKVGAPEWTVSADAAGVVSVKSEGFNLLAELHRNRLPGPSELMANFLHLASGPSARSSLYLFTDNIAYFSLLAGWHLFTAELTRDELIFRFSASESNG